MLRLIFSLFFFLNIATLYSQESNIDDPYLILSKSHDQKLFATLGSLKIKNDLIKKIDIKISELDIDAEHKLNKRNELINQADFLIRKHLYNNNWFPIIWMPVFRSILSAEEADEISNHFETEVGNLQKNIIDLQVIFEPLQWIILINNKIDTQSVDLKKEFKVIQDAWWERAPSTSPVSGNNKEILKLAKKISNSHEAIKFAGGVAGKNYVKTIAVEGIGAIEQYFNKTSQLITEELNL